jgi:hypothetical protein
MVYQTHLMPARPSDWAFLGYALADYRVHSGLSEERLLTWLGRPSGWCPALELARRPDPRSETFEADVRDLAARFGLNAARLSLVLRELADEDANG